MASRLVLILILLTALSPRAAAAAPVFRAGAASIDVTPERFPVVVNCGFTEASGAVAKDRLHARALVLDDGAVRLGIVIVDSCMMPREFLDRVKGLVAAEASIPTHRLLIAATHTHTAPAVMGCLGSSPDPVYGAFLERQLVQVVRQASAALQPAKAGWGTVLADGLTNNRRWVLRSDRVRNDPFGEPTVRANMHPGYLNPDFVGPSGPVDPWLSVLSVRTADDRPLAVLANFSMHYYGAAPVSADYFGRFCELLEKRVGGEKKTGFTALMSQGTAGDLHWMDYGKPQAAPGIEKYSEAVVERAEAALATIRHRSDVSLAMEESTIELGRRLPKAERLAWARKVVAGLGDAKPKTQPEIYAREALFLKDEPRRELKLQAIRVGDLGIAAIPNEVFALTGLHIKAQSPLPLTFSIELANGADGYIPPAEQHVLGGYTTWPARSAGLAVGAEARIRSQALGLLEKVAGKKQRALPEADEDDYARLVLAGKPAGYWRFGELKGSRAFDLVGGMDGRVEPGVVRGLDGPVARPFKGQAAVNRASHFCPGPAEAPGGGSVPFPKLGDAYSLELWIWNGFPTDARDWTGAVLNFQFKHDFREVLMLGGRKGVAGALALLPSPDRDDVIHAGKTPVAFRTWSHVVFIRAKDRVQVFLNGRREIDAETVNHDPPERVLLGAWSRKTCGFEGRLAEVAVYDRALTPDEIAERVKAVKK